jgi:hypothetical protein
MWVKDTPENRSLAAAVERDAKGKAGVNFARRACWYGGALGLGMIGAGGLLAGAGIGAEKAMEGYAAFVRNQEIAEREARTTAAMLAENRQQNREDLQALLTQEHDDVRAMLDATTIKSEVSVKGEVGLKDGGLVGLKPGQQVGLADGAEVALRKGGTVGLSPGESIGLDVRSTGEDGPHMPIGMEPPAQFRGTVQGAPRSPVFEPPAQLRTIGTGTAKGWGTPPRSPQFEPLTCKGARG